MNISELFIRRPVMTTLVTVAIFVAGIMGLQNLPQSNMPNVDFPTIQVMAALPGASPETIASSVATPLEKEFSSIAGLASMNSSSSQGVTQVTLQFELSRNIDTVSQDVQAAISKAQQYLPSNMPAPPSYEKVNPAMQPIFFMTMSSETLPLSKLYYYASNYIAQKISMLDGVSQVEIYGAKYAVRVKLDPKVMAARSIGMDEVASAIQRGNVNLPTGTLYGDRLAYTIKTEGQLHDAAAYNKLIVTYRNGSPVRLGEIGNAIDSIEEDKLFCEVKGTPAIVLAVKRQPGANTVAVVARVRQLLPVFKQEIPPSLVLTVFHDQSESIKASVNDVKFTLVLTVLLVIFVIFLFLRTIAATVIPAVALSLSIIATFAGMYVLKFSLDILSMMALTLAAGFVVDDAIVMLENIVRHTEMKEKPFDAALNGSREIGFTIMTMTISLVVVFLPFVFMGGVLGKLLNEFAVTISMAILLSGGISLFLTPMMCSRLLKQKDGEQHGRFYQVLEGFFNRLLKGYERTLHAAMRRRGVTLTMGFGALFATFVLFAVVPKGFIPSEDQNFLFGQTEAAQGISHNDMVRHQRRVGDIIGRNNNVLSYISVSVPGFTGAANSGFIFVKLLPREKRKVNADQVLEQLRASLSRLTGINVFLQNPPAIPLGSHSSKSPYQFILMSTNIDELYARAANFETRMRSLDMIQDVTSDLQIRNPEVKMQIDRDKSSALGISPYQIEDALFTAYGSRNVSYIYESDDQYKVITELKDEYQNDPSVLSYLYIRSTTGQLVPLSTVTQETRGVGPVTVNHQGQLPSVMVSFGLKPGVSLGTANDAVKKLTKELPTTISTGFQGTAQAFKESMGGLGFLFLLAILVIYIVLGILYEDFIHPITILSGIPSAAFGALLTLLVFRMELDIYAVVGILMLIGIVKKNAIMMIDFALEGMRKEGLNEYDAILKGCLIRFRPILMTSVAAFMGALPIAIGVGASGASRRSLGVSVCGGLLVSQILTLYLTPVLFTYFEDIKKLVVRRLGRRNGENGQAA